MSTSLKCMPWRRIIAAVIAIVVLEGGGLFGIWQVSRSRNFQLFGEPVNRVETDAKVVALTFDDGPTPRCTPGILALLAEKDVTATSFLIGDEIEANPDQTKAIVEAGHEVGTHTYTHDDMTFAFGGKVDAEVERTDKVIRAAGYSGEILFRPPFGKKFWGLPLYLAGHDRTTVTWDVEPESYDEIAADPYKIAAHVIANTKPGSEYKARLNCDHAPDVPFGRHVTEGIAAGDRWPARQGPPVCNRLRIAGVA